MLIGSLLYPGVLTAASILVDNLLRAPFAASAEADLELIHNMRQIFPATAPLITVVEEFINIGLTANRQIRPAPLPQIPEQPATTMFEQTSAQVPWHQFEVQDPDFLGLQMPSGYGQDYSLNPSVPTSAPYQSGTSSAPPTFQVQPFSGISPHLTTFPFPPSENPSFTSMPPVPNPPYVPQPPSPAKGPSHRRTQSRPEMSSRSAWMGPGSPSRRQQQSSLPHSPIRTHHAITLHAPYPSRQTQVTVPQPTQQSWDPNNPQMWVPQMVTQQSQQGQPRPQQSQQQQSQQQQRSARSPQRPGHRKNPSKSQSRGGHK